MPTLYILYHVSKSTTQKGGGHMIADYGRGPPGWSHRLSCGRPFILDDVGAVAFFALHESPPGIMRFPCVSNYDTTTWH